MNFINLTREHFIESLLRTHVLFCGLIIPILGTQFLNEQWTELKQSLLLLPHIMFVSLSLSLCFKGFRSYSAIRADEWGQIHTLDVRYTVYPKAVNTWGTLKTQLSSSSWLLLIAFLLRVSVFRAWGERYSSFDLPTPDILPLDLNLLHGGDSVFTLSPTQ